MKFRRYGPIIALMLLCVAVAGCLFEPREAEDPTGGNITYLDQSQPENVLANLETAFNNLDPAGYERQIATEFQYQPDSGTQASYPDVEWDNWNREQEFAFIEQFFNNVEGVTSNLNEVAIQTGWEGNSAELQYIYSVRVAESGGEVPYRGRVTLEFRLDGTFWKLFRWFDEQGEEDPDTGSQLQTLGQRRGAFAVSGGS